MGLIVNPRQKLPLIVRIDHDRYLTKFLAQGLGDTGEFGLDANVEIRAGHRPVTRAITGNLLDVCACSLRE